MNIPLWRAGVGYITGEVITYGGNEYRVTQDHTSVEHSNPEQSLSLYSLR